MKLAFAFLLALSGSAASVLAETQIWNGVAFRWISDLAAAYETAAEDIRRNGGRALHRITSREGAGK